MANTTFSGPVRSLNGFYSVGANNVITITAATTSLTTEAHAGRLIRVNAATATLSLPTIVATADPVTAGPGGNMRTLNNIGSVYTFFINTTATSVIINTITAADIFLGVLGFVNTGTNAGAGFVANGSSNNTITFNGTTTGGIAGTLLSVQAVAANRYLIIGSDVLGSGTLATPFSG